MVTKRMVAGFLGGFLGILACGYFSPAWLPLGCFVGFFLGIGYAEILVLCYWSICAPKRLLNYALNYAFEKHELTALELARGKSLTRKTVQILIDTAICAVFAQIAFGMAIAIISVVGFRWHCLGVPLFVLGFLICIFSVFGSSILEIYKSSQITQLRLLRKTYKENGSICFIRQCLNRYLKFQLFVASAFIMISLEVVVCTVIILPLAILRLLAELLFRLENFLGYLVCVAITALSAWLFHSYLQGASLWLVAFANGMITGFAVEKTHQPINLVIGNFRRFTIRFCRIKDRLSAINTQIISWARPILYGTFPD